MDTRKTGSPQERGEMEGRGSNLENQACVRARVLGNSLDEMESIRRVETKALSPLEQGGTSRGVVLD